MKTSRLEAFSDGVIAIIITIMVLELEAPDGGGLDALAPLVHVFVGYLLSFAYVGLYWYRHHHLLMATEKVSGPVLWANLHFLFWLSLLPFATDWIGESRFAAMPTALYGGVLLMTAVGYRILQRTLVASGGAELARAVGNDWKSRLTPVLYVVAIASTFVIEWVALGLYVLAATMWLVPDRRSEVALQAAPESEA